MSQSFQAVHLFYWIFIPGVFSLSFLLAHHSTVIPLASWGLLGDLLSYLILNYRVLLIIGFWAAVIAHGLEAMVARRICRKNKFDEQSTALWTVQTFILGFPSLNKLQRYAQQRQ